MSRVSAPIDDAIPEDRARTQDDPFAQHDTPAQHDARDQPRRRQESYDAGAHDGSGMHARFDGECRDAAPRPRARKPRRDRG